MVLGLKGKNRRGGTVQVDYRIHVQEIKPWPPSQSLKSLRSVLIQWENGDRHSGSTNLVVPTIGSIVGEGKIEFNESFRLPVTLVRDTSVRGGKDADTFQKNCIEFNLFETRREKSVKGQLLASAILDLAEFGVVRETLSVSTPMNCQRNFKNTLQPVLFITIHPIDKGRSNNSLRDTLSRGMSSDSNGGESISTSTREEYMDENEIASFTDDDVSSHSSMTVSSALEPTGCPPHQGEENGLNTLTHGVEGSQEHAFVSKLDSEKSNVTTENEVHGDLDVNSSIELSSDPGSPENENEQHGNDIHNHVRIQNFEYLNQESNGRKLNGMAYQETPTSPDIYDISIEDNSGKIDHFSGEENVETKKDGADGPFSTEGDIGKQSSMGSDAMALGNKNVETKSIVKKNDRLKHVKSVRSPLESAKCNGSGGKQLIGVEEIGAQGDSNNSLGSVRSNERKDSKVYAKDTKNTVLDSKVQQLQNKIKMLEGELREAAAIEAALYSVVAEHGSSVSKVHAPARRLSRLYLHCCRETSQSRKAYAAKSVVSGFVLIAKACGNDVPRLTFWLSNSVVLRTIISQATMSMKTQVSSGSHTSKNGASKDSNKLPSALKWKASSPNKRQNGNALRESFGDWEDTHTFASALVKVEAWIFSRIIESIWWQTLTPHMQSATAKNINQVSCPTSGKNYKRSSSSVDQDQGNFSLDLWKKAFRDACERICPVRAGGHECGCLPLLSRLIMEQCVARLDTAMFNAILRDSADEIPTDPVSDPISESKVLPIPAGKSSFGAGAQLKNAIGNWSRWLTDLFGLDDDDQHEDENDDDRKDTNFKSFYLLNALSDLMMLPKDMLLSRSIRKEVCPLFGAPVIKRVLEHFVPDEFCPEPIPSAVLEAVDVEEDPSEADDESIVNLPCTAASIAYNPPSATSVAAFIGEVGTKSELRRSRSSVLRKSYTSDDELDELNSPFTSILDASISSSTPAKSTRITEENCNLNALRYQLLRDVWVNSE